MLAQQRQAAILERVRTAGGVRVTELAAEFGVSDMTIRRDLDLLHDRGLLAKVHGGATVAGPGSTDEPGFRAKSVRQLAEKAAIATRAADLVPSGAAIALSAGTTTAELARRLVDVPGLTVVTNSLPVAEILHAGGRPDQTVVLTGGVRTPSDALVGPLADAAIRSLHVDLLFLGVHGMDPVAGLTTPNLAEAETNRSFLAHARRVVVVADHTKWRTVGLCAFGPLSAADVLVTDERIEAEARAVLGEAVGELVLARVGRVPGRDEEEDR